MHTFFLSMYHTERPATLMKKEAPKQPFLGQNCVYVPANILFNKCFMHLLTIVNVNIEMCCMCMWTVYC